MKVAKIKKTSGGPQTMAELLAMAKTSVKSFTTGDRIPAKVTAINPKSVLLDIGGKSEGIVMEKAYAEARDFIKTVKVGDTVTVTVIAPETREGNVLLSFRQAAFEASWGKIESARKNREPLVVLARGANPAGVSVIVEGVDGFIPLSQLGRGASENPQNLIGKYFKAQVIEASRSAGKVILSERAISEAVNIGKMNEALAKIKEGEVYDGIVTTIANFGCFVALDLGDGKGKKGQTRLDSTSSARQVEGLVHISELAWNKVASVSEIVKVGDKVKIRVLSSRDGKLALSIKQAQADPWEMANKKYLAGAKATGRVAKLTDFGVFVELEPGIEGLVHITKIPPATRLKVGDEINCTVEEIDSKSKKLSLGLVLSSKPIGYK